MSLWWLQPGWQDARCAGCGRRIYPEGDPDWGLCYACLALTATVKERPRCAVCHVFEACADVNGLAVCSQECADMAEERTVFVEPEP